MDFWHWARWWRPYILKYKGLLLVIFQELIVIYCMDIVLLDLMFKKTTKNYLVCMSV